RRESSSHLYHASGSEVSNHRIEGNGITKPEIEVVEIVPEADRLLGPEWDFAIETSELLKQCELLLGPGFDSRNVAPALIEETVLSSLDRFKVRNRRIKMSRWHVLQRRIARQRAEMCLQHIADRAVAWYPLDPAWYHYPASQAQQYHSRYMTITIATGFARQLGARPTS